MSLLDLNMESKLRTATAASGKTPYEQKRAAAATADKSAAPETANAPKVYDVSLKVSGVAFTDVQVAQFISKLNQSRLLKDVNLLISDEYKQGDEPLRKFQIEATLDPDADVAAATATASNKEKSKNASTGNRSSASASLSTKEK